MSGSKPNSGIINVYKEKGYTSHDVVAILKKLLKTKKVGHAGTLDPDATGVLVVAYGKATKVLEYLTEDGKSYTGTMIFGIQTDTQDVSGKIINTSSIIPSKNELEETLTDFIGINFQKPPIYSAVKVSGKKLYEYARDGKEVDISCRKITINELVIDNYVYPNASFMCSVSKGTYVRTIVNDIGVRLKSYASLENLTRIKAGNFYIEDSHKLDDIKNKVNHNDFSFVQTIDNALEFESLILPDFRYDKAINGLSTKTNLQEDEKLYKIYCKNQLIGIGKIESCLGENQIVIKKMLLENGSVNR